MSTMTLESAGKLSRFRVHRVIRQAHIWVGAWGALAAVLFGVSGFLQNHRGVLKLPQGSSVEVSRIEIPVPDEARMSAEAFQAWLARSQHLRLQIQRAPQARAPRGGDRADAMPARWVLSGGNARTTIQAEYNLASDTALIRTSIHSPVDVLERLHKGIGGGIAWILLSDSFAVGLVALGLSGLAMWSRNRTARQMVLSIAGGSAVVLLVIGASATL